MNSFIKTVFFFALAVGLFSTSFSIIGHYPAQGYEDQFLDKQLIIKSITTKSPNIASSGYPDATGISRSSVAPSAEDVMPGSVSDLGRKSMDGQQSSTLTDTNLFSDALLSRLALQKEEARQTIGGQYIVVLKQEASSLSNSGEMDISTVNEMKNMASEMKNRGAEILNIYRHALNGYSIKVADDPELLTSLRDDPRVALVE